MNPIVCHIVSGHAFFSGIAMVLTAVFLSTQKQAIAHRFAFVVFSIGILFVVLSSTPIPYWYYGLTTAATLFWLLTLKQPTSRRSAAFAMVVLWLGAVTLELPWHFVPGPKPIAAQSLTIIGDSVTSGMGEGEAETWPGLLAAQHRIGVQDLSHVGETARSALKRIREHGIQSSLLLVEIGGNDILGSTTSKEFERDLDTLLTYLKTPGREILMFELPLPPFCHEFGRVQRTLASRHGVHLIPKRVFLDIIAMSGATLDSIHLSQSGHQQMADLVWSLIEPAIRA